LLVVVAGVNVEKLLSNRELPGSSTGVVMEKTIAVEIGNGFLTAWLDCALAQ